MDLLGDKFKLPANDMILADYEGTDGSQLRVNMETIGFSSAYTSKNMGSTYLILILMLFGMILIVIIKPLRFFQPIRPVKILK